MVQASGTIFKQITQIGHYSKKLPYELTDETVFVCENFLFILKLKLNAVP